MINIYWKIDSAEYKKIKWVGEIMIKERLQQLIFNYNFEEAKEIFNELNEKKQDEILSLIAFDTGNILVYTFIGYLIFENNTAFRHSLAAAIMSSEFCWIEGAYETAFFMQEKHLNCLLTM